MPLPPLIGINCDSFPDAHTRLIGLREPYCRALLSAGAVPVLIPFLESPEQIEAAIAPLEGFVLTGGDDFRPERLGRPSHPRAVPMSADRDRSDFLLIEALLQRAVPTLAICLGMQELNVAMGGTVYEDLPSEHSAGPIIHMGPEPATRFTSHGVSIEPRSVLADIWQGADQAPVNSAHHQGVRDMGKRLAPLAHAPDGLVEAFAVEDLPFFLAVQWHPERMPDDPRQRALFSALAEKASALRRD